MQSLYLGFFGLTLSINPAIHALDGPMTNPGAYWTTLSAETSFVFRLLGAVFIGLVISPKYFDVKITSFNKMMLFLNVTFYVLVCARARSRECSPAASRA